MKKVFTFLLVLIPFLAVNAQKELIRNGDFSQGVAGSHLLKDIYYWNMDMESPGSQWWEHVAMISSDTSIYQVVEEITSDSVLYTCTFNAANPWQTDKIRVVASLTGNDSTIRTPYATKLIGLDEPFEFKFGFSENSAYVGKKLVIELDIIAHDTAIAKGEASWCDIDDISLKKIIHGVNTMPTAIVGPAQTVKGGTSVSLDGSGSTDPEGTALTYMWTSVYPGIFLSDRHSANPTFIAPDVTELTTFEFTLFVSDGELSSEMAIAYITVYPAGELVRNGGFEDFTVGSDLSSTSLKDVASWYIDMEAAAVGGGRDGAVGAKFTYLSSKDSSFYQVLKTIGSAEATYTLGFSARSSWDALSIRSKFSVSDADSSVRTVIDSKDSEFGIDPGTGNDVSEMKAYSHIFVIPANSEYAGKKLILEFECIPYDVATDNGWLELDNVSLIEILAEKVDYTKAADIMIYPNPASDVLYLNNSEKIVRVQLYSVLGKQVGTMTGEDIRQVNVNTLSNGIYLIRLTTRSGVYTRKFQVR
jgi:hypothetical protein